MSHVAMLPQSNLHCILPNRETQRHTQPASEDPVVVRAGAR